MISALTKAPVIALYLGESYASLGAFDSAQKEIVEKTVFLPQVSLKNLLTQTKQKLSEAGYEGTIPSFFLVTKYLDRLRNFRLGGSVAQVVAEGFENSYSLMNTSSLSLAAASLVISVTPQNLTEAFLETQLTQIKKVNPDANKVVIQLSEKTFSPAQLEMVHTFFTKAEFHVFNCAQPENLAEVRKTLLNAGTEGTKEEILSEIKEIFGEQTEISFWCENQFKQKFENHELFGSSNAFLAQWARASQADSVAYFDHEGFRLIQTEERPTWNSPWGAIPTLHFQFHELYPHPFSEVRLDHLSMICVSQKPAQHEPGPVCAGRGIKPLVLDLFYEELGQIPEMKSLFCQFNSDAQKQKLENHLAIIEKGQTDNPFKTTRAELKKQIVEDIKHELNLASRRQKLKIAGPLVPVFGFKNSGFNWPQEILKKACT